jgi:hypothetical protein
MTSPFLGSLMPFSIRTEGHAHVFFQEINPSYELPDGVSSRMQVPPNPNSYHPPSSITPSVCFYRHRVASLSVLCDPRWQVQAPRHEHRQLYGRKAASRQTPLVRAHCVAHYQTSAYFRIHPTATITQLGFSALPSCLTAFACMPRICCGCLRDLWIHSKTRHIDPPP